MFPHVGVVGLGVLVLDPSGGGGDGDYVKNNGEEQQQGQDPPAAGVGDPTAEHGDRRSEFCGAGHRGEEERCGLLAAETWRGAIRPVLRGVARLDAEGGVRGCVAKTGQTPPPK